MTEIGAQATSGDPVGNLRPCRCPGGRLAAVRLGLPEPFSRLDSMTYALGACGTYTTRSRCVC